MKNRAACAAPLQESRTFTRKCVPLAASRIHVHDFGTSLVRGYWGAVMTRSRHRQARSVRRDRVTSQSLRRGLRLERLEPRRLLAFGDFLQYHDAPAGVVQSSGEFGFSIASDGNVTVFGSPGDDISGVNNAGQVHLVDTTTGALLRTIPNPFPDTNDRFGHAVALSGNGLVVGAYLDDTSASDSGSVYVFDASTGQLQWAIANPNPAVSAYFGFAVAATADRIAASAYQDNSGAGTAYLFSVATGSLVQTLTKPGAASFDNFGYALAMSGGILAVGTPRDDTSATDAGAVVQFDAATGAFLRKLTNPTPASFESFGNAVAMSGNRLAVGAYRDGFGAANSGAAYVFNAETGAVVQSWTNPTPGLGDNFGYAIAISGSTVIVGAYRDDTGAFNAGIAYQLDADTGGLVRTITNPSPTDLDYFSSAVAVADSAIFIGSYWDDTPSLDAGSTYQYDAGTGASVRVLHSPTSSAYDYFGYATALSASTLVVSAFLDDRFGTDAGAVHVLDADTGQLLHTLAPPVPQPYANFGYSIAVAGNYVVVGAYREDRGATDSGCAYVFDLTTGALISTLLNPSPTSFDYFGYSVDISAETVVVGAYRDDSVATDAGTVYLFDASTGQLTRTITSPSLADSEFFGYAVSVDGGVLAVGSPLARGGGITPGAVHLFETATGATIQTLENPTPGDFDYFGSALAMANNRLVVGAYRDDTTETDSGAAYLFQANTASLVATLDNPSPGQADYFGYSVDLSYQTIIVGAYADDTSGVKAGAAYVYDAMAGGLLLNLAANPPENYSSFGLSVSASHSHFAVGIPQADNGTVDRGRVALFDAFVNAPPVANAGGPYEVGEGIDLTLDGSASSDAEDPVGQLTLEWDLDYDGVTFGVDATGLQSVVNFPDDFAARQIGLRVIDSNGASQIATTTLRVTNVAPAVSANQPSVTVDEGGVAQMSGTYSDVANDVVNLTASVGTLVDAGDGTWEWTMDALDGPGFSQVVTVTATDEEGASQSASFDLVVQNVAPSVAADAPHVTVDEGSPASMSGTASDVSADTILLEASVGSIVDQGNGTWSWTYVPADGPANSQTVTVTASDEDGGIQTTTFELTVNNLAPTISANQPSTTVPEGETAQLTGTFADLGADMVTLTASDGTIVDSGNGTWTWSFDAQDGPDASRQVQVTATDDDGAAQSTTFDLVVTNEPPTLTQASSFVRVLSGTTAENQGTFGDPGDDVVVLSASVGQVVDHGDGTWSWSFTTTSSLDSQQVSVTATDSDGASQSVEFQLEVNQVLANNRTVVVPEGGVAQNTGVYLSLAGDVAVLTVSVGEIVDPGNGQWSWSFAAADGPDQSQSVTLTATYPVSGVHTTTFDLAVENVAPDVTVNRSQVAVASGNTAQNSGTASDVGLDAITLTASLGEVTDHGDGTWSWSLANVQPADGQTVVITATDSDGAPHQVSFDLLVDVLSVNAAAVEVLEGNTANNTGTYELLIGQSVLLSSSVGSIVDHSDGTWSWSWDTTDGPDDSQSVTITATYSASGPFNTTFPLTVQNVAPVLAIDQAEITIRDGDLATNSGTFSDAGNDVVTLAASVGTVVDLGNGTWNWTWQSLDGTDDTQTVTITATDSDGASRVESFLLHDVTGIESIWVNNGSLQRSMVTSLEIRFDVVVDMSQDAFLVERLGGPSSSVGTLATASVVDGRTMVVLTFSGAFVDVHTGSLRDGSYRLTIDGSRIRSAATSVEVDVDNDGSPGGIAQFGEQAADAFFRRFGDVDGDGGIGPADVAAFNAAFGSSQGESDYNSLFDFDGDGDVDSRDRRRFQRTESLAPDGSDGDVSPFDSPAGGLGPSSERPAGPQTSHRYPRAGLAMWEKRRNPLVTRPDGPGQAPVAGPGPWQTGE